MGLGAVVALPLGALTAGAALLDPVLLGLGAVVALLSSALPYSLELIALRRLSTATFSVLASLGPAIAALAGYLLLGQTLTPLQLLAVGLVIAASAGAVHTSKLRCARTSTAARTRHDASCATADQTNSPCTFMAGWLRRHRGSVVGEAVPGSRRSLL